MSADLHKLASALNDRQRRFAEELVKGCTQAEAYKRAGYKCKSDQIANEKASRLLASNGNVSSYLDALRASVADETVLTLEEKRRKLASIVRDLPEGGMLRDQLSAIKIDNEMAGHNKPQEIHVTGSLIQQIREAAKA